MNASVDLPPTTPSRVRRAALKLVALFAVGAIVLLLDAPWKALVALGLTLGAAMVVRAPLGELARQVRVVLPFVLALLIAHSVLTDWQTGSLVALRILVLVLAAATVTATTRTGDLLAVIERLLGPLRHVGVDPTRVGLVLPRTIRLVPLLADTVRDIREAQRARGVERPGLTVVGPLVIAALRTTDDLADALDARGLGDRTDLRGA